MRTRESPFKIAECVCELQSTHCGFRSKSTCFLSLAWHAIHIPWEDGRVVLMLPGPQTAVPGSLEAWNPARKASTLFFGLGNLHHSFEILEFIEQWFVTVKGAYAMQLLVSSWRWQILLWANDVRVPTPIRAQVGPWRWYRMVLRETG